jgi:hypothetical protein
MRRHEIALIVEVSSADLAGVTAAVVAVDISVSSRFDF